MAAEPVIREMSPRGFPIYWMVAAGRPEDDKEGADFWATSHGYVSVSPMQIDLTAHKEIDMVGGWMHAPLSESTSAK